MTLSLTNPMLIAQQKNLDSYVPELRFEIFKRLSCCIFKATLTDILEMLNLTFNLDLVGA